ncbi:hypothetical protein VNI00_004193 [Paramarasmius palmivorus]|uniref:Hydrophobin n=1 Tax=Paramarasmius palmivorus TaxID=297713 RepID=A0AAW0DMY0_9AGAR
MDSGKYSIWDDAIPSKVYKSRPFHDSNPHSTSSVVFSSIQSYSLQSLLSISNMQFNALLALIVPAIVLATPVPHGGEGGSTSVCSSGGTIACNNGGILSSVLSSGCSTGNVYCCFNSNNQVGYININDGNCQQQNFGIGEDGGILSELLGSLL